jgi:hypothetical protein
LTVIILVLALVIAAGLGHYFKIIRLAGEETGQSEKKATGNQGDRGVDINRRTGDKAEKSGIKEFVSKELGVSFKYPSYIKDISVEGNRIKVDSKSVEIFDKASEQTLQQAIEDKFLGDYSPSDCWVDTSKRNDKIYAMLEFPRPKGDWDLGTLDVTCPRQYASVGGLTYFMMDPSVPDKFAVFFVGQDRIMVSDTLSWDDTFEFLR